MSERQEFNKSKARFIVQKAFEQAFAEPLTPTTVEWQKAVTYLINSKGAEASILLARFLAKEFGRSSITQLDFERAAKLVEAVRTGDSQSFQSVISQVFQLAGGAENFTNLRSPGTGPAKMSAQPGDSGDYDKLAHPHPPDTGFYDSSAGMRFSGGETRGDRYREPTGSAPVTSGRSLSSGRDTQRLGYGSTSQAASASDARSQQYGELGGTVGSVTSRAGQTHDTTSMARTAKGILRSEIEKSAGERVNNEKMAGLSAEVNANTGEIIANPTALLIGSIISKSAKTERIVDKITAAEIKKSKDLNLAK